MGLIAAVASRFVRAAWWDDNTGAWDHHDPKLSALLDQQTPQLRRTARTDADIMAMYGAVFAAIRRRQSAVIKPEIVLFRKGRAGKEPEVIEEHEALTALKRVNESLTFSQGFGLIEQHKCTAGSAFWIKRRAGGRTGGKTLEFEIWDPMLTRVIPDERKPWVPKEFRRRIPKTAQEEVVAPEDVLWMRHVIDPRNLLNGLSPIGAVRVAVDTSMEALRYNQKWYDNDANPSRMYSMPDASQAEVERVEQEMERRFRGTDNKHKAMIATGEITEVSSVISHKDMEFMEQLRYTKAEVATVFEISPVLLGDLSQATKENLGHFERAFWTMIVIQVQNTLDEMTEFWLTPEYGDGIFFGLNADGIPALQADKNLQADVDAIYLDHDKVTINELRERDGEEPVEWGDGPSAPAQTPGTGAEDSGDESANGRSGEGPASAPIRVVLLRSISEAEDIIADGWERRLRSEMRAVIDHLRSSSRNARFVLEDVETFNWDWWERHRREVIRELEIVYAASLADAGFIESPLLPAQQVARNYAFENAGNLLQLTGRRSLVDATRAAVRREVVRAIDEGIGPRQLANRLRENAVFSKGRAEMIARTETAFASTDASLKSYQSLGHEGKEWLTAGDERVDAGSPSTPCIGAEAQGPIALGRPFNNGREGPPIHPRCRCTLLPVRELPRRTLKIPERDEDGRILRVVETTG